MLLMPWCCWCADVADALMLLMPWCCWCADAADSRMLLIPRCCWCAGADVCVAVVVAGVVDQDQNQDQVMDLSLAFCSSLMRPRIVFHDWGKFFLHLRQLLHVANHISHQELLFMRATSGRGQNLPLIKILLCSHNIFIRLPCQGCIYERQYWNYYSGKS